MLAPVKFHLSGAQVAPLAMDALDCHVCVTDQGGTIVWVNRAWRRFAKDNGGIEDLLCEGANYLEAIAHAPADDAELHIVLEGVKAVLDRRQDQFEHEYACHSPNEERWFVLKVVPINAESNCAALITHTPTTARCIAERKSRHAQKMEALGTMASGIAHDFNNMLAAVIGEASLAQSLVVPASDAAVHLERLLTAAGRARALVQQIVLSTQRLPSRPSPQRLAPLIDEVIGMLESSSPASVRFERKVLDEQAAAEVPASDFARLLSNLGTNAAYAVAEKGGVVQIGLSHGIAPSNLKSHVDTLAPGTPVVHLWVCDDGCGISESTQHRMFDPFFTTKPIGVGTGLGLAIVRGIVVRAGGAISVRSKVGNGTTIDIYFPLPAQVAAVSEIEDDCHTKPPINERLNVLLVDDDDSVGLVTQALLEREGHAVTRLDDPAVAWTTLNDSIDRFDLLITDQRMPQLSGVELARKSETLDPRLPVIILTGYVEEDVFNDVRTRSHWRVLQKERMVDALVAMVADIVDSDCEAFKFRHSTSIHD